MRKAQLYLLVFFLLTPNSVFSGSCSYENTEEEAVIAKMMNRERIAYCISG